MAAQIDGQDDHDRVQVAFRSLVVIVELVVYSARAGDLVVNRVGETRADGPSLFASEDDAGPDIRRGSRSLRDVVIELLRVLESHSLDQTIPEIPETAMHKDPVSGLVGGPFPGPSCWDKRGVGAL